MYRIEIERRATKALARLPGDAQERVMVAIDALAEDPRPAGCVALQDAPQGTYRVRVGRYRVIYIVLDNEKVIVVAKVGERDESTYKGL